MTAAAPALPGFRVERHLGSGGLGDVWLALRESTGGHVAVKLIRDPDATGSVDRRVRREVAALLVLKGHPAVIHVEEVLATASGPALVMEYASGGSLLDHIRQYGSVSTSTVCDVGTQVARLLADAHRLGIIHRDIKPHNILRTAFGGYKVCDFGIAAVASSDEWANPTSALSYRYASPEEIDGAAVSPASDVFSLGVTLVQARTGQPSGVRTPDLRGVALTESDRALQGVLTDMLAHDPQQRLDAVTVAERLAEVGRLAAREATTTTSIAATAETIDRPSLGRRTTGPLPSGPAAPRSDDSSGRDDRQLPDRAGENWWE